MDEKYIITIGRQLGSGGKSAGEMLSSQLNISCYDKELIQLASKESGLSKDFFEQADEKNTFSLTSGLASFWKGDFFTNNYLSNESLFKIQSDVIRMLAEKHSSIFVGRCADYILRESNMCANFFISANMEYRIQLMMLNRGCDEQKAIELINYNDRHRAEYYNYYTGQKWGYAGIYDLCLNTSTLGMERCADMIIETTFHKLNIKNQ